MKCKLILFFFTIVCTLTAQNEEILSFNEYIDYVKSYHPIAKQALLKQEQGKAEVLKSRGSFDPKLVSEFQRKDFKKQDYYNILDAKLKVPTWFGLELEAGFEKNTGIFLNPQRNVPKDGLYSAGASLDVFGIWIDKRRATLKKAKVIANQRNIESQLLLNDIVFEAATTYFLWKNAYDNKLLYNNFVKAAKVRMAGVKQGITLGDKAPIDSVEAKIALQNRQISLKQAEIDYQKARLDLETYLWTKEEAPLELRKGIAPENALLQVSSIFNLPKDTNDLQKAIANHPKLALLDQKTKGLSIERRLKIKALFPKLKVKYNFISPSADQLDSYNSDEFKAGFSFSYPLFLRKERASLKLNTIKQESLVFETKTQEFRIKNKLTALANNVSLYEDQAILLDDAVINYQTLLKAEERKFGIGESSLFLINSREQKLINVQLKQNSIRLKLNATKAKLYNALGIIE